MVRLHIRLCIFGISLGAGPRSIASRKALVEVVDDVVDVLQADRDSDHIFSHAGIDALLFRQLLVCRRPRVDCKCLGISDTI